MIARIVAIAIIASVSRAVAIARIAAISNMSAVSSIASISRTAAVAFIVTIAAVHFICQIEMLWRMSSRLRSIALLFLMAREKGT